MSVDKIISEWESIQTLIEATDLDVRKNANGNSSAGLRARKSFRTLRSRLAELTRATIAADKARKDS